MEVEVIYSNKIGINQTLVSRSMHSFIATFTFKEADKHSFIKNSILTKKNPKSKPCSRIIEQIQLNHHTNA